LSTSTISAQIWKPPSLLRVGNPPVSSIPDGLRIAYLVPAPGIPVRGPSGSSAHVRALAQAWVDDHDIRVFAARLNDRRGVFGEPVKAVAVGAPGWPSWLGRYRDLVEVAAARRVSERVLFEARNGWTPDVIVERHTLFSDAGWRLHDALGVPWVLEVNAPPTVERERFEVLRRPRWASRWERSVLQACPTIVTVSRWLVKWLEEEIGCRNVHWVPNGVAAIRGNRARGRALLGLEDEVPVVGFVGSMKPWHGADRLAQIADAAGARLAIVGPPSVDIEGAICTGHLNPQALADAVSAMDVGLAPYPADAPPWFCPLKVLDYRAQGTPVVASDIGETRALVGQGGTVVPADDIEGMIAATRGWLGQRTNRRIRSWHRVGRQMLAIALGLESSRSLVD
jgi:starch synthase